MKTTLYYFSGTGNSLKIARDLSDKLEECELVPIAKVWQLDHIASTSEKVGFIFPMYYYGLPKIVYDFLNKIELDKSNYFFAVITRAGELDGGSFQQIEKILKVKSKTLSAGFFVTMPNNFSLELTYSSEELQKLLFEKAIKEIEKISEFIKDNKKNLKEDSVEKKNRLGKINKSFIERVNESDKSFYAENNCTGCGICEKICPVNNIVLIEGMPQWQHKCQQCLACINLCPEKVIQFGTKTLKTQRYHHPEIIVKDLINQKM